MMEVYQNNQQISKISSSVETGYLKVLVDKLIIFLQNVFLHADVLSSRKEKKPHPARFLMRFARVMLEYMLTM